MERHQWLCNRSRTEPQPVPLNQGRILIIPIGGGALARQAADGCLQGDLEWAAAGGSVAGSRHTGCRRWHPPAPTSVQRDRSSCSARWRTPACHGPPPGCEGAAARGWAPHSGKAGTGDIDRTGCQPGVLARPPRAEPVQPAAHGSARSLTQRALLESRLEALLLAWIARHCRLRLAAAAHPCQAPGDPQRYP